MGKSTIAVPEAIVHQVHVHVRVESEEERESVRSERKRGRARESKGGEQLFKVLDSSN